MAKYKDIFNLTGKVSVIFGATGLIGSAFAEGLADYGSHLALVDMNQSKCDLLAEEISLNSSSEIIGLQANIADRKSVEMTLEKVLDKFGKVDVLVNSAQNKTANFFQCFEEFSDEEWDQIVNVNLKGVYLTCQIFGIQMVEQGGGSIINLASTYAVVAPNQQLYEGLKFGCPLPYAASKGGVVALSKYLAAYWAEKNVRVNMISPHGVYNNHEEQFVKNFSKMCPMGRMANKEEVVSALIYLASDASSFTTGHNLVTDGGWSVW